MQFLRPSAEPRTKSLFIFSSLLQTCIGRIIVCMVYVRRETTTYWAIVTPPPKESAHACQLLRRRWVFSNKWSYKPFPPHINRKHWGISLNLELTETIHPTQLQGPLWTFFWDQEYSFGDSHFLTRRWI